MSKKTQNSLITLVICNTLLLFYSCGQSDQAAQQQPGQAQPRAAVLVMTQDVTLRDLNEVLDLPGSLEPENIANVLSTSEGKITQMNVRQGDHVSEGQLLAMLSPLLREDIINAARLSLQAKENEAELNPDNSALEAELRQARSDYEFALNQYREIPVVAPVSGTISDRWVDIGDMVAARHKMFEIHSNKRFLVKVPVSELDIRRLNIGQSVHIESDACPERYFRGSIQRIYPQVDRQSRSATVEVILPDPCPQLRSGMFVRASFTTRSVKDAVAVPVTALLQRGQQQYVYVVDDMKASEIIVETGLETSEMIEIVSGLEAGRQLVIEGQEQLQPGSQVRIHQGSTENTKD